jgi:allantoin racemase
MPVLALEDEAFDAAAPIRAEVLKALQEDQCGAVVLGCAGMARLAEEFGDVHGFPVIDGVTAAVRMCETLIQLRLRPILGDIGS